MTSIPQQFQALEGVFTLIMSYSALVLASLYIRGCMYGQNVINHNILFPVIVTPVIIIYIIIHGEDFVNRVSILYIFSYFNQ